MTTVACTLVSLCLCVALVCGRPAAKKLPHDSDDVLAGSDFLSVFMHRRTADRPDGPFEPHLLNSVTVNHGSPIVDLVKPYVLSNIYKTNKYGYAVHNEMQTEVGDYQNTTPDINPTLDTDVKTTTLLTEPTTIEDIPTTADFITPENTFKLSTFPNQRPTITTIVQPETKLDPMVQQFGLEKVEEKVVVRVSSSVARHSHRTIETSTVQNTRETEPRARLVDENLVSTLVTQEQPTITAVQRSQFAVEEAALPSPETAVMPDKKDQQSYERQEEVEGKVQEVSLYGNLEQGTPSQRLPVFEIHYSNPPEALVSAYSNKEEIQTTNSGGPVLKRKEFRQLSPYSVGVPTSYHSRVSSPTSASSIQFYREHNRGVAETVEQPVVTHPYPPQRHDEEHQEHTYSQPEQIYGQPEQSYGQPEQSYGQPEQSYGQPEQNYGKPERSYGQPEQAYRQSEQVYGKPERNYGQPEQAYSQPEQNYGQPEQNYEVDEAVSVMTNGRAHGVQLPTPTPGKSTDPEADQNKFGYVVEGRNFRKYRVEERTPDGFIVGEYGVVSHDDGSLRGVRYTADSTINPRLIYDTLVKFLSLK